MAEFTEIAAGDTIELSRENILAPAVRISNASSGVGLEVDKLVTTSTTTISTLVTSTVNANAVTFTSAATASVPLTINRSVLAGPTTAVLTLSGSSTPSVPVFEFSNKAFVSVSTITFITGVAANAGVVGAKVGNNFYWIPLLPAGSVTGIAW